VASDGAQGNVEVFKADDLSEDGARAVFTSSASNLVAGDTNNNNDVFVHEVATAETTRVSVASDGSQANSASTESVISPDGRFVAFQSTATNLVADDTDGTWDVFVRDLAARQTACVSCTARGTTGNGHSFRASISRQGRFVAFTSRASDLVAGDTNGEYDVFVRDMLTGMTSLVSVSSDGAPAQGASTLPAITPDGRFVAFVSSADNLVVGDTDYRADVFVHDRQTGSTSLVSVAKDGSQSEIGFLDEVEISSDGRYVVFAAGYTQADENVFVHDRQTGTTTPVNLASDGTQGNGYSMRPSLSADGRFVAFFSSSSNLVPDDTNSVDDFFVRDRLTGRTARITAIGMENDSRIYMYGRISLDGRVLTFHSEANLVSDDTNNYDDAFITTNPLAP